MHWISVPAIRQTFNAQCHFQVMPPGFEPVCVMMNLSAFCWCHTTFRTLPTSSFNNKKYILDYATHDHSVRHTQYWIQNKKILPLADFTGHTKMLWIGSRRFFRENVSQWSCGPVAGRAGASQYRKRPDMQRAVYIWTLSFFFHGASSPTTETGP